MKSRVDFFIFLIFFKESPKLIKKYIYICKIVYECCDGSFGVLVVFGWAKRATWREDGTKAVFSRLQCGQDE